MKKIFIFGLFTRIFMILSILFMIYLPVDDILHNGIDFINFSIVLILMIFLCLSIYWQWTVGVFLNFKKNRIKFSLFINKSKNIDRVLSDIDCIELDKKNNLGFDFVIKYKNGYVEKINYKFFRMVWLESFQIKRIKKELNKLNIILK